MLAEAIDGGFGNPVFDAQAVFKAAMDAMASPGSVVPVPRLAQPPASLSATAAALALALCDHDTPLWLDSQLAECAAVYTWLGFHCGAPLVDKPATAAFAIAASPTRLPPLDHFAQGTQEYPDRSTTVILQMDTLRAGVCEGRLARLRLRGPGIWSTATLSVSPLPANFASQWQANGSRFPRGVDVILAGSDAVACLPRSVRIEMEG